MSQSSTNQGFNSSGILTFISTLLRNCSSDSTDGSNRALFFLGTSELESCPLEGVPPSFLFVPEIKKLYCLLIFQTHSEPLRGNIKEGLPEKEFSI